MSTLPHNTNNLFFTLAYNDCFIYNNNYVIQIIMEVIQFLTNQHEDIRLKSFISCIFFQISLCYNENHMREINLGFLTCRCSLRVLVGSFGRSSGSSSVRIMTPNTAKNMMKMKKLILARSLAREGAARHFIASTLHSHEHSENSGRYRARHTTDSPAPQRHTAALRYRVSRQNTTRRLPTLT